MMRKTSKGDSYVTGPLTDLSKKKEEDKKEEKTKTKKDSK